jgi:hypothetical protein
MTTPMIGSNIIFQQVGYSEDSTISLSRRRQFVLTLSGSYIYIPGLENNNSTVIHFVRKVALYFSTPAVNR